MTRDAHTDPTALCALAVPGSRPPVGAIVRATDAPTGELAVGRLVRYGSLLDPDAGIPYVQPQVGGGLPWQACPEFLRPATPDEIDRAREGAER